MAVVISRVAATLAAMLVVLSALPFGGSPVAGAALDPEWRSGAQGTFTVVYCEGDDGLPGTGDERPKNNADATGTLDIAWDAATETWVFNGELSGLRNGNYRAVLGSTAGSTGPILSTFTVDSASSGGAQFEAGGVVLDQPDDYDVVWIQRNGPPWGGGSGGGGHEDGGGCEEEDGEAGGCPGEQAATTNDEAGTAQVPDEHEGSCGGGGGGGEQPGSKWRIELEAPFSLGPPTISITKEVVGSASERPSAATRFQFRLECTNAEPVEFTLGDGETAVRTVSSGQNCTLLETARGGASATTGLFSNRVVDSDMAVTVINKYDASDEEDAGGSSSGPIAPPAPAPVTPTPEPTVGPSTAAAGAPPQMLLGFVAQGPTLMVLTQDADVASIVAEMAGRGAEPEGCVLGSIVGGRWVMYIAGAPHPAVNAAWHAVYPQALPVGTPLFARC